jgi:hypothetical protein
MKQVHKKSDDEAVNQLLVAAYRQRTDLAWDRAEAQQPQCGFGQLGIRSAPTSSGRSAGGPRATSPAGAW